MASSTAGNRAGSSERIGTWTGMPASRMRRFARTRRCAVAAGCMANTPAMRSASKPSTTWSMSGVRTTASIAGCAHANSISSRLSGISSGSRSGAASVVATRSSSGAAVRAAAEVSRSRIRLRATVTSHPCGFSGTPVRTGPQRPLEAIGERILGEGDIPRQGREQRHEPPIRRPRNTLGNRVGSVAVQSTGCAPCHEPSKYRVAVGRIST